MQVYKSYSLESPLIQILLAKIVKFHKILESLFLTNKMVYLTCTNSLKFGLQHKKDDCRYS